MEPSTEQAETEPQTASPALRLDECDWLRYQLLGQRVLNAQIRKDLYRVETARAENDLYRLLLETSELLKRFGQKYGADPAKIHVGDEGQLTLRTSP